jgi:hypothetical protein
MKEAWSVEPPLSRTAPEAEIEIPRNHPWFTWLVAYHEHVQRNGGRLEHDVLTVTLGGVTQHFDLIAVKSLDYHGYQEGRTQTVWRMHGDPSDG